MKKQPVITKNFIDLGLPSGTLWAEQSEEGYYTFDEAIKKFGKNLPTKEQFEELCSLFHRWDNKRKGIEFLGNNGNKLFLPAMGCGYESGLYDVGSVGHFWSSSLYESFPYYAWELYFGSGVHIPDKCSCCCNQSVCLVR